MEFREFQSRALQSAKLRIRQLELDVYTLQLAEEARREIRKEWVRAAMIVGAACLFCLVLAVAKAS